MCFEGINFHFLIEEETKTKNFQLISFFFSFKALIRTPTGKRHTPNIDDNHDGTVSIKYQPEEVGLHELDVFYQRQAIAGSPFKFHVDQVQTGYVTAYGPGLSHGVCNESSNFRIVTKDAGSGGLSVAVEGSSKAEIQCKDNKDGTCDVTYWPVRNKDLLKKKKPLNSL